MTFIELAKQRYSVRHFSERPVENEKIISVLEAGRIAPSAANRQPWEFIVIQLAETRKLLSVCYKRDWIKEAPVMIVACGNHKESWIRKDDEKDHCDIDIGIAVDHMTLAAAELGLGTCWVCSFDAKRCADLLNLPDYLEPVVLLPLGYPKDIADEQRHAKLRKPLESIVHWENYIKE